MLAFFVSLAVQLLPAAIQAEQFSLDDGTVNTFGGTPGGDFLALNHFHTAGRTVAINQISVIWNPLSSRVFPTVALYSDPDGDGNPSDARPLMIYPIFITPNVVILNNTSFQSYDIPATTVTGSFFVGAYLSDRDSGFDPAIGVDLSHPQPGQSWIVENSSGVGLLDLQEPIATSTLVTPLNTYVNGNHMIRARYSFVASCVQPSAGLISWWPAETNANDTTGSNHGIITTEFLGPVLLSPGKVGNAFDFRGTNFVEIPPIPLESFTLELWALQRVRGTFGDNFGSVLVSDEVCGVVDDWHTGVLPDGRLVVRIGNAATGVDSNFISSNAIPLNTFTHIAVTRSTTTGKIEIYFNGVLDSTQDSPHNRVLGASDPTCDTGIHQNHIGIGNLRRGAVLAGNLTAFDGLIDEVSIYRHVLSAVELQAVYAAGSAGKCAPTPSGPPSITTQPQDQVKRPGSIVTLAVIASGTPPLNYQWFFNGNALAGRTNAALTLTNVQSDQAGPYFVTVSNGSGSVTSSKAQLTVTALLPPVCTPAPTGAVAWWRAESNTVDSIGINDGLPQGSRLNEILYTTGKVGAAFRFFSGSFGFGLTNYLFVPPSADLNLGAGDGLSIEGWIRPDSVSGVRPLLEWNDSHGSIGAGLAMNGSALEAYLTDTNTTPIRRIVLRSPPGIIGTSVWQHVALTFDKVAGLTSVYLNGVPVTQTNIGSLEPLTRSPVYLAYRPSGTSARSLYSGGLDEMTLYQRALSATEIQAIVAADEAGKCVPPPPTCVPPPSDFVAWWRGESNVLDSVDASHGVVTNSVTYTAGIVGKAIQFNTGFVRIPASSNLNVGAGPGLTIEAWISPQFSGSRLVFSTSRQFVGWHSGIVTQGVSLSITRAAPKSSSIFWEANLVDSEGRPHVVRSPEGLATLDVWQHVALTYDKATGVAALYFDGSAVTRTNLGTFTPKTTANVYLGYQTFLDPFRGAGAGALDEVSLYARALSAAEIRTIMLSRGVGKCQEPPVIVSQPVSIRVNEGADATFSVAASGNPILKYQWRRDGVNLPGATGASIVLTNVQFAQAGTYSVRITNAFGVAESSNAVLTVNRPPLADATATPPLVIAPAHCNPIIVLDGSRSSDPDDDPLQFFWFQGTATSAFATGVVAVVTLPVGTNSLRLVVDDGMSTNAQTFTVEVITSARAVERLMTSVNSHAPKPQPLIASLLAAIESLNRDNATAAINQLQAFQNKVGAQVAPSDPTLAQKLNQAAQEVIGILSGGCSSDKLHGKIGKLSRNANGKLRMHFTAPPGPVYVIEASTNLIDWEKIGVATDGGSGEFEFEDANAPRMPTRFYRIVIP
ncbi:MAG: immunoglobulin domain-containing protein [Verrucomicrobia bacterium]|nr:immunoglobulin domain-containing protein [Verrucomicrobiota bacterium]